MKKVVLAALLASGALIVQAGTFWDSGTYYPVVNVSSGALTNLGYSSGRVGSFPQRWWAEPFSVPAGGVNLTKITADGFLPNGANFFNLKWIVWKRGADFIPPVLADKVGEGSVPLPTPIYDPRCHFRNADDSPFYRTAEYFEIPLSTPLPLEAGDYYLTVYADGTADPVDDANFAWFTGAPGQSEATEMTTGMRSASFPSPGFAPYTLTAYQCQPGIDVDDLYNVTFSLEGTGPLAGRKLSGKILFSDYLGWIPDLLSVYVRKPGTGEIIQEAYVSPDGLTGSGAGAYEINLPVCEGTQFDVTLWLAPFLRRTISVDVTAGDVVMDIDLINGDIDGDNAITVFDYNALSEAFDSVEGDTNWNANADLDGDGGVTVFDYNILSKNFDMVGDD